MKQEAPLSTREPYALVQTHSAAQEGLRALGWKVTDTQDGWDHMEPPEGRTLIITDDSYGGIPILKGCLEMEEGDLLIVSAPGINQADAEHLRYQVDNFLDGKVDRIVANFDIRVQAVRLLRQSDSA